MKYRVNEMVTYCNCSDVLVDRGNIMICSDIYCNNCKLGRRPKDCLIYIVKNRSDGDPLFKTNKMAKALTI